MRRSSASMYRTTSGSSGMGGILACAYRRAQPRRPRARPLPRCPDTPSVLPGLDLAIRGSYGRLTPRLDNAPCGHARAPDLRRRPEDREPLRGDEGVATPEEE